MTRRTVYLVRHGAIERPDDQRRYIGQIDLPLAAEGRQQARQLRRSLAGAPLGGVFASDLARARETAEIVAAAAGVPVELRADLREIAMGAWEGRAFREIAARFPDLYRARGEDLAGFRAPGGGESFAEVSARVVRALDEILARTRGALLVVGHAGGNRLLLCHMLGMPVENLFRIGQDHGCLNVIECGRSGFQVHLVNGPPVVGTHRRASSSTQEQEPHHARRVRSHRPYAP
jgi:probable phosphoglycerate mutase